MKDGENMNWGQATKKERRDEIWRLSLHNRIINCVHATYDAFKGRGLDYEDALSLMVIHLAEENERLFNQLVKMAQDSGRRAYFEQNPQVR